MAKRNNKSTLTVTISSFGSIFKHADYLDKCLMALGTIGAIGNGMTLPIIIFMSSKFFNHFGNCHCSSPSSLEFVHYINKYALFLLYLACGSSIAAFLEGYCWSRTGERQSSRIRAGYLKAVLRQDIEYFDTSTSSSAEVINYISNDGYVIQDVIGEKMPHFISSTSTFFSGFCAAFLMSWRLSVVASPMMVIVMISTPMYGKKLMSIANKIGIQFNEASVIAEQAVSSIRTVYSSVAETKTVAKYSASLEDTVKLGLKLCLAKGLAVGSSGITYAIWAFIIWYGSYLVMYHGVEGGTIFGVGSAITIAGHTLASAIPDLKYFAEASSASEKIMEVMKRNPKIDTESAEGEVIRNVAGNIEFKRVQFAYPARPDKLILNNFSLEVSAGKTVALVGGSGAGKSTVVSLLERFYDPLSGEILLDGVSIQRLNLKWLRSQMGLVSQEPALLATTIKENILFGKAEATMEEIVEAAKLANAHDFISRLPQQYDTQVGEGATHISGGQKQRIAIARAILRCPKILLLDEATSALDTESERVVQAALATASIGRTTIIVAHRLSTVRDSDVIAVLQSGQVVEMGSHNDLISDTNGLYSSLVRLQQSTLASKTTVKPESNSESVSASVSNVCSITEPVTSTETGNKVQQTEKHTMPSFWRLIALNKPEWRQGIAGCLSTIVVGSFEPLFGFTMASMISVYFLTDHSEIKRKTMIYCILFALMTVVNFMMYCIQHYYFGVMGERLTKRIREKMLSKILKFEVGWFDREENSTGAICSQLAKDANVVKTLVGDRISVILQTASTVTIACVIGLFISWRLAIVMIAVQPLMIISIYIHRLLLKSLLSKVAKFQAECSKLAAEAVSNLRTITAFSSQDHILQMFEHAQQCSRNEIVKQAWITGASFSISQCLMVCIWAVDFWYGGKLMMKELIDAKSLFQTFMVLIMTGRLIAEAGSTITDLTKGANSVGSIFAILDRRTNIDPDNEQGHKQDKLVGYVDIQGVSFSYPVRPDVVIFKDFSLSIKAGKSTALVGQSGSGKSTIIGLIERFYDPLKGSVMIDGKDIKSYNLRSLRKHIGLVSQEPVLFAGTISENIAYGIDGATQSEIENAARAANAHEFISSFKDGYNTNCGSKGMQLSGGQKQRIAIAKAMLKNPTILLLDEATSALDSQSEKVVQEALERLMVERTSVVVAHRLSTIRNCDVIVVLDKGNVVEMGNHASLISKGGRGYYYGLVSHQQGESHLA